MTILLLIQSTAILAGGFGVLACMRRRSSAERHAILSAMFAGLLVLPLWKALPSSMAAPSLILRVDAVTIPTSVIASSWQGWTSIWLAGFILALCRIAWSAAATLRIIQSARRTETENYPILYTPTLTGPAAWGIGLKLVLMPECAIDWDPARSALILRHEAAHLRRNDCWMLLVSELACAFYWCNPLVWIAASRLRREQEHAADDEVLNSGADSIAYAAHLVALAKSARAPVLSAGAVTRSHLADRVQAILDARRHRSMPKRTTILVIAAAVLALTFPLATMQAQRKVERMVDKEVSGPKPIEKYEPEYTEQAKDAKIEGTVVLDVVIEADGKIYEAAVVRGLDPGLDANAVSAVKRWRFAPATKAGQTVAVAAKIEVNFRLR
jgi:TonB family protein